MIIRGIRLEPGGSILEYSKHESSSVIELFISHQGHNYFICGRQEAGHVSLTVSCISVIDLLVGMCFPMMDQAYEYEKVRDVIYESYDFVEHAFPGEAEESDFYEAFKIVMKLLTKSRLQSEEKGETIRETMKCFLGKDVSELSDF